VYFYVVEGPNGNEVMSRITETAGGSFRVEYTPTEAGMWNEWWYRVIVTLTSYYITHTTSSNDQRTR